MKHFVMLFVASLLAVAGCEEQGPAEEAGENIDERLEEARDFAEDSAESIGDEAERLGDRLEEATDDR